MEDFVVVYGPFWTPMFSGARQDAEKWMQAEANEAGETVSFTVVHTSYEQIVAAPEVVEPPTDPGNEGEFYGFDPHLPPVVFVSGIVDQRESLIPFIIDTSRKMVPQSRPDRLTDWTPSPYDWSDIEIKLLDDPVGLSVGDDLTIHYNGSRPDGDGNIHVVRYTLTHKPSGVQHVGMIQLVTPTDVWGYEAGTFTEWMWPNARTGNAVDIPFAEFRKGLNPGKSAADPCVLFITPGSYSKQDWFLGSKPYLYLLGHPHKYPELIGDTVASSNYVFRIAKHLDLRDCGYQGTSLVKNLQTGKGSLDILTACSMSHATKFQTCVSTPSYEDWHGAGADRNLYPVDVTFGTYAYNLYSTDMGSTDGTQHLFYVQSRPRSWFSANHLRVDGTRRCDIIKSTRSQVSVRNSRLSAVENEEDLAQGYRSAVLIDIPCCAPFGPHVIYNNELIGASSARFGGVKPAMVYFRSRRDWNSADDPHYPDLNYEAGLSRANYNRPASMFIDPGFWDAVRVQWETRSTLGMPNDELFLHFVAHNKFRWIAEEDTIVQTSAFRTEGTYPREAMEQFSAGSRFLRVPSNWVDRSVTHFWANTYEGFLENQDLLVDDESEVTTEVVPGARWPRDPNDPTQWPSIIQHFGVEMPNGWVL